MDPDSVCEEFAAGMMGKACFCFTTSGSKLGSLKARDDSG